MFNDALTLHNAPPTHWQIVLVAVSALVIRATARLACTCDSGEDA